LPLLKVIPPLSLSIYSTLSHSSSSTISFHCQLSGFSSEPTSKISLLS
ncbi:unnamed protein product, partial [Brassica oleracea]